MSAKQNLITAINEYESIVSELTRKGLATRNSHGVQMSDTRHPKYQAYRNADSAYWNALSEAEAAGLVTIHNRSFSWK